MPASRVEFVQVEVDAGRMLLGRSPAVRRLWDQLQRIAPADVSVLITGRDGNRQGAGRAHPAPAERAVAPRAGRARLQRGHAEHARERALRSRARRVHGRRCAARGRLRARRRRHALPRRDRQPAAGCTGQAAARPAGARVSPSRRHASRALRLPSDHRDQRRSGGQRAAPFVPRGSLPPFEGGASSTCRRCASVGKTSRCWSATSSPASASGCDAASAA